MCQIFTISGLVKKNGNCSSKSVSKFRTISILWSNVDFNFFVMESVFCVFTTADFKNSRSSSIDCSVSRSSLFLLVDLREFLSFSPRYPPLMLLINKSLKRMFTLFTHFKNKGLARYTYNATCGTFMHFQTWEQINRRLCHSNFFTWSRIFIESFVQIFMQLFYKLPTGRDWQIASWFALM